MNRRNPSRIFPATVLGLTLVSSSCSPSGSTVLTADTPLHLEEHLDAATIVGSEIPADVPAAVEWRFDEPQPDWKPAPPRDPSAQTVKVSRTVDALRMIVREPHCGGPTTDFIRYARDGIYIDLPDWNREDWAYVDVRARASGGVAILGIGFNLPDGDLKAMMDRGVSDRGFAFLGTQLFSFFGNQADVVNDGSVQTYRMRADRSYRSEFWEGPWKQLGEIGRAHV